MTDLEVFCLSAQACGYCAEEMKDHNHQLYGYLASNSEVQMVWNPFTNGDQRWECARKLLEMGWIVCLEPRKHRHNQAWHFVHGNDILINCPAEEFPARALAELQRRKG